MNEKFCKDCPCYGRRRCHKDAPIWIEYADDTECWAQPWVAEDDWCYAGRQIMEKEGK